MSDKTQHYAPERVTDLLVQAYRLLEDAQAHADRWDRGDLGRDLDSCRWMLGDLIANITPLTRDHTLNTTTQEWELDPSPAFSNALDGWQP
jgi:hypothetical protein